MKKIIGVIPSRYASTRLPGKPLAVIKGISLIQRVWNQSIKAEKLDEVVVATDDKRVYEHVLKFGGKVVMTSVNCKSGTDRICEVARKYRKDAHAFVNIQGDEPLISPHLINKLADNLKTDNKIRMITAAVQLKDKESISSPSVVKVVRDKENNAIYFSRSPIPYLREKNEVVIFKHVGIYGYTREFLFKYASLKQTPMEKAEQLEQLRAIENGYKIKLIVTKYDSVGVDTPLDIKKVENILEQRSSK